MNSTGLKRILLLLVIGFVLGKNSEIYAVTNPDSLRIEELQKASSKYVSIDFSQALVNSHEALHLAEETGEKPLLARANKQLGYLNWMNGYYYRSIFYLDKSYSYFLGLEDKDQAASVCHLKGLNYYYMAMYDSAIYFHQQALSLYQSNGNKKSSGKVLSHISIVYHKMGKYDMAVDYMMQANHIRAEFSNTSSVYDLKSSNPAFRNKEYYRDELEFHFKNLEKATQEDDKLKMADGKHTVGKTYFLLEDYNNALKCFNESNLLFEDIGLLPYWNESVKALLALDRFEEALQVLNSYDKIIVKKGTRITQAEIKSLTGDVYYKMGDYKKALTYYQVNNTLAREMNNQLDVTRTLKKIADAYSELDELSMAQDNLLQSLNLARTIGAIEEEKNALGALATIESRLGNYRVAYGYEVDHDKLLGRINEGEASINMVRAQAEYEAFQRAEEINELKIEQILQESRVSNLKLSIIGAVIVVILILLLTIIIYRKYRLEAKTAITLKEKNSKISSQKVLLEDKNSEIELLLGEIHHRVKNNLQVINSLLSIQSLQLKDKKAKSAVTESKNRVQAMGLIHENLYQNNNFGAINMDEYLHDLCNNLTASFGFTDALRVDIETHGIKLDVDTAIPLGLIANELVTNSLKYAFPEVDLPVISMTLLVVEEELHMEISDNGCGMDSIKKEDSFGLSLVEAMAKRMSGEISTNCASGTTTCLVLKKFKIAA